MKTIYLVRHADALQGDAASDDIERPLLKKGKKDAKFMGRELKKMENVPKLIISSPAARALETAGIFAEQFGYPVNKIMVKNSLYESDSSGIIGMMQKLNDKYDSIILFGHNPTLSDTAKELAKDYSGSLDKTEVIGVTINRNKWRNIVRKQGTMIFRMSVKEIMLQRERNRVLKEELGSELTRTVKEYLAAKNWPVSDGLGKRIDEMSRKISKQVFKSGKPAAKAHKK